MNAIDEKLGHKLSDFAFRSYISAAKLLPFEARINLAGWMTTNVVAPLTGNRKRIRENLTYVMPELSHKEREAIVKQAPESMGRILMEIYSGKEFLDRIAKAPVTGPGYAVIEKAHKEGKGALLVTGHIGNYLAVLGTLLSRGIPSGSLYKSMSNTQFNDHYVDALTHFSSPMFARGRRGMADMIRHLRAGGFVGIAHDQRMNDAPLYDFMGKPAHTAESTAGLALKYGIDVVPCYGIRQPDGSYEIQTEAPIAHTNVQDMTQALNDSLDAKVRAYPGQWMWTHNRWHDFTGGLAASGAEENSKSQDESVNDV